MSLDTPANVGPADRERTDAETGGGDAEDAATAGVEAVSSAPNRGSVCVFTTAHSATDARVVDREARSLAEAGHDVTYYTPRGDGADSPVDGVERRTYGSMADENAVPGMGERLRLASAAGHELAGTDYDVYHFHDAELLPVGAGLSAATDGAVVYDVHENVRDVLGHKDFFPESVREPLASLAGGTELGLSHLVDALVVASPDIAERFARFEEVTTVTNYPRRSRAEHTDMDAQAAAATDGEATVAYCGLLSEERGITTLVDAVERVPEAYDVSLVLGGKYESDAFERRLTERAADSDRVEVRGWLPTLDDVVDMFREADIGAFTFRPEPNKTDAVHRSNKLFQYMATGLPLVVSDVGEWSTLVTDEDCGVPVDPRDPSAVADALAELTADADRRVELARNGHRAALERYNWETQRDRLLDLYDELV
jgi:glycosyltransferase involved in cell wall biosynthesis